MEGRFIAKRLPAGSGAAAGSEVADYGSEVEVADYWPTTSGAAAGSEHADYWATTNGAVAGEDEGDQKRKILHFSKWLVPENPISPPPFFEMEDRRLGAFLGRFQIDLTSGKKDIYGNKKTTHLSNASIGAITGPNQEAPTPKFLGGSIARRLAATDLIDETHSSNASIGTITGPNQEAPTPKLTRLPLPPIRQKIVGFTARRQAATNLIDETTHSSNASIGAITGHNQEVPTPKSTSPNQEVPTPKSTRPPLPPTRRTTVGFTARRQAATDLIVSIFKKKRQTEIILNSVGKEQSVEVEPSPTSFGLARIFSYEELKEATNCFKQQIGEGGFSSVYLGKLPDQRMVAVKVLYEGIPKRFEQFINEVTVLSRLRHKNLVVLYGCTDPETQKFLLVYELVPNGTIANHLHGELPPLTWAVRIQLAIETAEALAYLHSLEPPIIHRDVKTSNILLDNNFHVKVADLGMCRLLPWDTKSVTTQPQGTQGYRDPEYEMYCNLTDKSDVYSFGVVLLELISGQQAVDVNREKNDIYLFRMALNKILNKELEQLVDPKLGYHSDCEIKRMIDLVADLACICLQTQADMRPSMLDVVSTLKKICHGT